MTAAPIDRTRPDLARLDRAFAAAQAREKALRKQLTGDEPAAGQRLAATVEELVAAFRDAARASPDQAPWAVIEGIVLTLTQKTGYGPPALSLARMALAEARARASRTLGWTDLVEHWTLLLPRLRYNAALDAVRTALNEQRPTEAVAPLDVLLELETDPARRERWQDLKEAQASVSGRRGWGLWVAAFVAAVAVAIYLNRDNLRGTDGRAVGRVRLNLDPPRQ